MTESRRQEVFNVMLAQLLQERSGGSVSAESIIKSGIEQKRHMPDVIVNFQGLRTAIEAEIEGSKAADKALESARRRVEDGIAQIGVAVVYPEALRFVDFSQLKTDLAAADLSIAVVSEAEETGFSRGNVDYLERILRSTYDRLIREDVVAEAVALLDVAVDEFAAAVLNYRSNWQRLAQLLNESLDDADLDKLNEKQRGAYSRIAGLIIVNAMIFHGLLSETYKKITELNQITTAEHLSVFFKDWDYILTHVNYYAIFHIARYALAYLTIREWGTAEPLLKMVRTAEKIGQKKAALRHDLMGRVYHRLLAEAKYLGTYYTSIPAAALLLKLALRPSGWETRWDSGQHIAGLRFADLSCGTGTLLAAAADTVLDNYISALAAAGGKLDIAMLHRSLLEAVLHGYDVLPSAVHLTASTLAMRLPDTPVFNLNLFSLPMGGPFRRLGSIEFLRRREVELTTSFMFKEPPEELQISGIGMDYKDKATLPELDLAVMNPPFVRSVGGNLLFGSLPEGERAEAQESLKNLIKEQNAEASITAGLGSVFVATADRYLKPTGRMALVLPKALLSGVAWGETRALINRRYRLDYVIVSHDAERWNFSESTDLSEVLVVASRTILSQQRTTDHQHKVIVVNLWRNPRTMIEALSAAYALLKAEPPDLVDGQGALAVPINGEKGGEAVAYSWMAMKDDWFLPAAFAQTDLTRAAYHLLRGDLWLPGRGQQAQIPLCPLGELGELGPDARDVHDGFEVTESPTAFSAFWGHDSQSVLTIAQQPNKYLAPLPKAKPRRPLRKVEDLWPLAGKIMIAERLRLNTQRLFAIRLPQEVLSSTWWAFRLTDETQAVDDADKALALWLNSTPGLMILLAAREETEGAWVKFKKPSLGAMPALDARRLKPEQVAALAAAYDRLCAQPLQPFPQMAEDETRREIDAAISAALELPDLSPLRTLLAREPVVCMRRL